MKRIKKIGVLFSGGVDSAALLARYLKAAYQVWPVYTTAGLPWEKAELTWAKRLLKNIQTTDLKPLTVVRLRLEKAYDKNWSQTGRTPGLHSSDEAVYLPARNLLLITKALLFLSSRKINEIAIATLKGNPFPDGRESYFRLLEKVLSRSFRRRIFIRSPFRTMEKIQIIRKFPAFPFHLTFSCINMRGLVHCGRCNKCAERKRAFKKAGVGDRTAYKH